MDYEYSNLHRLVQSIGCLRHLNGMRPGFVYGEYPMAVDFGYPYRS